MYVCVSKNARSCRQSALERRTSDVKLTAAGAKAIAVDDAVAPKDAGEEGDALANRDQAAIPSRLEARTLDPQNGRSPVLHARLLHAAARNSRKSSNCFSAIMAPPSTS